MMYLYNRHEELIHIVRDRGLKSLVQTLKLTNEKYISDVLESELSYVDEEIMKEVEYISIPSRENKLKHHFYWLKDDKSTELSHITGVQTGIEELRKKPIKDFRPAHRPMRYIVDELIKGSNWQIGYMPSDLGTRSTNFYYTDAFSGLKKTASLFGVEFQFFVEVTNDKIGARYIDFKREIGGNFGARVAYGHNALEIVKETSKDEIYTALIGRGKGEQVSSAEETGNQADGYGRKINFGDIEAPDKPLGQEWIEDKEATQRYGIYDNVRKVMMPKIGYVDFPDEEDKTRLLNLTRQALNQYVRPRVEMKTSTVYLDGDIGDNVRVVRPDRNWDFDTRIFEIRRDLLTGHAEIKLGDKLVSTPYDRERKLLNATTNAVSKELLPTITEATYKIVSANGGNYNYYGAVDPIEAGETPKIDDTWYQPHPDHEGHTIIKVWNGTMWEVVMDTYNSGAEIRAEVEAVIKQAQSDIQAAQARADEAVEEIDIAVEKAGFTSLDETISSVQAIGNSAQANAQTALDQSLDALGDASLALNNAQTAINTADSAISTANDLSGQVSDFELTVDGFSQVVNDYEGQVSQFENTVNGLNSTVANYATEVDEYGNAVNTYATEVSSLTNTVDGFQSKVDKVESDYQGISGTVATHTAQISNLDGEIALKANTTTVNALTGRVDTAETGITTNANDIKLKANTTTVNALTGRVSTAESGITANANAIKLKASQSSVDTLSGTVSTLGAQIDVTAGQISNKVWMSDIDDIEIGGRNLVKGTSDEFRSVDFSGWNYYVERNISVKGDTYYTLSARVIKEFQNQGLLIFEYSDEGVLTTNYQFNLWWGPAHSDMKRSLIIKTKPDTVRVDVGFRNNQTGENRFRYREFQFEQGNIASDWEPAIEDTDAKFDYIETEWTQTFESFEQTITGEGGINAQLQTLENSLSSIADPVSGRLSIVEQTASGLQSTVADKANQSQVTQLSNAFNVYIEDSSNLIYNPYFAGGSMDSWTIDQVNNNDTSDHIPREWYTTHRKRDVYNTKEFAVRPGEIIELSLYAWSNSGSTGLNIGLRYFDKNMKHLHWSTGGGRTTRGYITARMHVPKNARFAQFWVQQPLTSDFRMWWFTDAKATRSASHAQLSVLDDNINLRVAKNDVINQINISNENILIQSDNILLDGDVTVRGTAWMDGAVLKNLSVDGAKITNGTIGSGKIANLDVDKLNGNLTNFFRTNWDSAAGGNVAIDGNGIVTTAPENSSNPKIEGSQTYIQNGIVGTRQPNGATIGQIGYIPDATNSPVYRIGTSWGTHFALNQRFLDDYTGYVQEKDTIRITAGGVDFVARLSGQARFYVGNSGFDVVRNGDRKILIGGNVALYTNINMQKNSILNQSDERLKTDIRPAQSSLESLSRIDFNNFTWREDGREDYGVIAQQVEQVAPELVVTMEDGYKAINSSRMQMMTTQSVKEVNEKVDNEIAHLQMQLDEANRRIEELEGVF